MSWQIDLIRTHLDVENKHDMAAMLATLVSEEPKRDEVANRVYVGREQVSGRYAALWEAFPDFNVAPQRFTQEREDVVVMEAIYTGTHRGSYLGHAGTGKSFRLRLVNVLEFAENRIANEIIYIDLATQLRQLGLKIDG